MNNQMKLAALAMVFCACFVIAPILSVKLAVVGLLAFPLGQPLAVFGLGLRDVIHKAFGKDVADNVVWSAFWIRIALWLLTGLVIALPGKAPPSFYSIVGEGLRVAIGGEATLLTMRYVDSYVFERFKGHGFTKRYHLSNLVSYILSLVLFVVIGFAGTGKPLMKMMLAGLVVRILISVVFAPLFNKIVLWAESDT
jgi:uncharacterized integral membrane protein (TIGR00697 family)